jgi:hypothetical protein
MLDDLTIRFAREKVKRLEKKKGSVVSHDRESCCSSLVSVYLHFDFNHSLLLLFWSLESGFLMFHSICFTVTLFSFFSKLPAFAIKEKQENKRNTISSLSVRRIERNVKLRPFEGETPPRRHSIETSLAFTGNKL